MTKYVLRKKYQHKFEGFRTHEGEPLYLYKSVSRDRHGFLRPKFTRQIEQARQWATREGAQGYLEKNLTYTHLPENAEGARTDYVVEEVTL